MCASARVRVRDVAPEDLDGVLALNNAHAREVNAHTAESLGAAVARAARARIVPRQARDERGCDAFLIAFDETTPAQGPNHAWFLAREPRFLYIDRVVVAPAARGRGLARALYEDLAAAGAGRPQCCEVNLDPPNPESVAFHERLGFVHLDEATDPRNGKRIVYLIRR